METILTILNDIICSIKRQH